MYFLKILLFVCAVSFGCTKSDIDTPMIVTPEEEADSMQLAATYSYLALGDSYTIGERVDPSERYPVQLAARLNADSVGMEDPLIIARTGWRTDNLQQGIADANIENDTFDLVSLLIGVNNQFQGKPISVYENEFTGLLQQAIEFAGGQKNRVFVISIPDYAFTPYGQSTSNPDYISQQIDAFNAVNKHITEEAGVAYYNITPISRQGLNNPDFVASDGLHPSGQMYAAWVDLFFADIKAILLN